MPVIRVRRRTARDRYGEGGRRGRARYGDILGLAGDFEGPRIGFQFGFFGADRVSVAVRDLTVQLDGAVGTEEGLAVLLVKGVLRGGRGIGRGPSAVSVDFLDPFVCVGSPAAGDLNGECGGGIPVRSHLIGRGLFCDPDRIVGRRRENSLSGGGPRAVRVRYFDVEIDGFRADERAFREGHGVRVGGPQNRRGLGRETGPFFSEPSVRIGGPAAGDLHGEGNGFGFGFHLIVGGGLHDFERIRVDYGRPGAGERDLRRAGRVVVAVGTVAFEVGEINRHAVFHVDCGNDASVQIDRDVAPVHVHHTGSDGKSGGLGRNGDEAGIGVRIAGHGGSARLVVVDRFESVVVQIGDNDRKLAVDVVGGNFRAVDIGADIGGENGADDFIRKGRDSHGHSHQNGAEEGDRFFHFGVFLSIEVALSL